MINTCAKQGGNDSLLIHRNLDNSSCFDYFRIDSSIEEDKKFNKILSAYIYSALVGGYQCDSLSKENLDSLFNRDSFVKTILLFYNDSNYISLNHYETKQRWLEAYDNLLYNCDNKSILHKLADTLLFYNKSNGIRVLWGNIELQLLGNFEKYLTNIVEDGNSYRLTEAIVIFHNGKYFEKRDKYIEYIKRDPKFKEKYLNLMRLIDSYEIISYEQYLEAIYGGI